jgi:hypothetical protein
MRIDEADLSKADIAALKLAMQMAGQEPDRHEQLESMLEDRPWHVVADFAASCMQSKMLRLPIYQFPPCDLNEDEKYETESDRQVQALLKRMLKAKISRWHPDPLAEVAGKQKSRRV